MSPTATTTTCIVNMATCFLPAPFSTSLYYVWEEQNNICASSLVHFANVCIPQRVSHPKTRLGSFRAKRFLDPLETHQREISCVFVPHWVSFPPCRCHDVHLHNVMGATVRHTSTKWSDIFLLFWTELGNLHMSALKKQKLLLLLLLLLF